MYLLVKSGGPNPYRNGDFSFQINSYMNALEKAELTTSVSHIERFSKSGMPIYNFNVPDTAGRKTTTRRKKQAITKHYVFHANTKIEKKNNINIH